MVSEVLMDSITCLFWDIVQINEYMHSAGGVGVCVCVCVPCS